MTDETDTPLPRPPARDAHSHKGSYGRVLVAGGSLGMAGAPAMAALACLRSGSGLVSLATPRCVQATAAAFCPALMTHALEDYAGRFAATAGEALRRLLADADAGAVGPGVGRDDVLTDLLVRLYREADRPLVVDADGLNALSQSPGALTEPGGPRVLTPHPGEFARLYGEPLNDPSDDPERREKAAELARRDPTGETVVVLKGARTVVTDGRRFAVNPTGNPGMATGGTGDVLTGVVASLLGQGLEPFEAARLGAYVHGLAGDLAAEKLGQIGMIATDVIDCLPDAWRQAQ
ncbi:NAD(P)H-hydrate dehydratase [Botrimarina sp.]|uniref:NAD(P)H-hydrate dehydratase n=1 Tax=Botrimarina sp. TaxID=2795802 RepID=UPI0032EE004C